MFSDSYKSCPFCAEDEAYFNGGVRPRKKGPGRRLEGHTKGPRILGPALIVVVVLMAAVLVYAFFGDKIAQVFHRDEPFVEVVTLTVEPAAAELAVGEIRALSAAGVEQVLWTSSDVNVATVDAQGNVTAVGPGQATVTVADRDGKLSAQCQVTVKEPQAADPNQGSQTNQGGNSQQPDEKDLAIGAAWSGEALPKTGSQFDCTLNSGSTQLIVLGTDAKVTWISSDESKVKVSEDGTITRVAGGIAVITAQVDGQTLECRVLG